MSDNIGLNVSLKGEFQDDPWLVLHADNPATLRGQAKALFPYAYAGDAAGIGEVIEHAQAAYRAELNASKLTHENFATAQGFPPAAPQSPPAPVQAAPAVAPVAAPIPAAPAAVPVATEAGAGGLPPNVSVWIAADPKKPEYQAVFFQFPYIQDEAARNGFTSPLKSQYWAKFDPNTKAWYAAKKHEAGIRAALAANAPLFA